MSAADRDRVLRLAERVTSASVCDAMGRLFDHRAHVLDLVSPDPGAVIAGPAATLQFMPNRRDLRPTDAADPFDALAAEALSGAGEGAVLVISSAGHTDQAMAGGKKVARVEAAGFGGLVTDGRLRDMEEIAGFDMPCYCSGETVRAAGDQVTPFAANVPVVLDEVTVIPGDWVYADTAGVVIVPAASVIEVFEEAIRIEKADADAVAKTRGRKK